MTERDPAIEPYGALIGMWDTEATHPEFDGVVTGTVTYEWLDGHRFVVVRSHTDHELFPDGISVIGAPESGDGLVMEYFDSRGVRRTYRTSLDNGILRIWRDAPGFDQRLVVKIDPEEFRAVYELARSPGEWKDDLRTTHRRRRPQTRTAHLDDAKPVGPSPTRDEAAMVARAPAGRQAGLVGEGESPGEGRRIGRAS